jgi:arginase
MENCDIQMVGVASGLGARDSGCKDGPEALQAPLLEYLQQTGLPATWERTLFPPVEGGTTARIATLSKALAQETRTVVEQGQFPVVVGGDHSCAIGTWSGVRAAMSGPLGLIWLDAHMDSHTPATSPSGAIHGMPLACLMGYGIPELIHISGPPPKLHPEHLCLIGVRSFENGEAAMLERLNVRVYFMEEVKRRGMGQVLKEAIERVSSGTAGYGLSIDLDALDPVEEPGVGSPAPDGLLRHDLLTAIEQQRFSKLVGLEIAEYNPHRDRQGATAALAVALVAEILSRR